MTTLLASETPATQSLPIITKSDVISAWKRLAREKQNDGRSMISYILLRALVNNNNAAQFERIDITPYIEPTIAWLKRSMPAVTNKTKLQNGRIPYDTLLSHMWDWKYTEWAGLQISGPLIFNANQLLRACKQEIQVNR